MMRPVSIIVIEDHPMMAQATQHLLEQTPHYQVTAIAYTGQDGLALVEQHRPDLVLLDFRLPDGPGSEVLKAIKADYPDMRVVVISGEDVIEMSIDLLKLGVNGIISKGTREETIRQMIGCVLDGQLVIPYECLKRMSIADGASIVRLEVVLDEQELRIMEMVVKGSTHEQMAEQLYVSKRSIDNYLRKIYEKMGVSNRLQAIERFLEDKHNRESGA